MHQHIQYVALLYVTKMKKHSSSRKLSSPCYTVGRPTIQTLFAVLLALLFAVLLALLCFDRGEYGSKGVEVRFSHTKVRRDTNNHHGRMTTFPNVTTLQYLQY